MSLEPTDWLVTLRAPAQLTRPRKRRSRAPLWIGAAVTASLVALVMFRPQDPSVTVELTYLDPSAHTVAVAGTFNDWNAQALPMTETSAGLFTVELELPPGEIEYQFVVNGDRWTPDPQAGSYRDDGFGSKNAVLML